jgi:hypothetical protein
LEHTHDTLRIEYDRDPFLRVEARHLSCDIEDSSP